MKNVEIKALRTRLHMTQRELAKAVGVEPNTVARWERGESIPSAAKRERLETVAMEHPSGDVIRRSAGVTLDPHHGAILEALNGTLDPGVFEACAVTLLQPNYPGLVAVTGGGDDGFDGAVADSGLGEPYPLIVTTGQRLVQNLTRNLDQARRKGWNPVRALFATSKQIKPAMRKKLFAAAHDRHVELIQVYDQDWFASRLYHEPEWCRRLLGVTGRPHALSMFPLTKRPVLGTRVLGREHEMRWLLNDSRGDCLLVGEPGSGKTFLLQSLALQGKARFLVDMHREQIANDLRSLGPLAVIVDDAHVRREWVMELMQIRHEVRADFRIIAVSWPGEASAVRSALHIGHENEFRLERINADTMIEVIKSAGVAGPDELLRVIRQQAAGRPGLAATLAHLCLVGNVKNVVSGESLVDQTALSLKTILGEDSLSLLAPFALGGDAGARQDKVAEGLGKPLLEVADMLAKLAASGVVVERPDDPASKSNWPLSVEPPLMRGELVRRIFYRGAGSLPVDRFLSIVQKPQEALKTLIEARACGASVISLEQRLEETNDQKLWLLYAWLGKREVDFVLDQHPELIVEIGVPALLHTPDRAIPMLLSEGAKESVRSPDADWLWPVSDRESVLDKLKGWIADEPVLLPRRVTLLQGARKWWERSRNSDIALPVMCIALNPVYQFSRSDPGMGTRITLTEGALPAGVIDGLVESWVLVADILRESQNLPWTELLEFLENFRDRKLMTANASKAATNRLLQHIMDDLANASRHHPGIQRGLRQLAEAVGVELDEVSDTVFECLYPCSQERFDSENLDRERNSQMAQVKALAVDWDSLSVDEIADRLVRVEAEARLASTMSIFHPRLSVEFCKVLAERRSDSVAAARAFMDQRLPGDLVHPFILSAIAGDQASWSIVEDCLKGEEYKYLGVAVALVRSDAPPEMISAAVGQAKGVEQSIEHVCLRGEVSEVALLELFRSENRDAAVAAALGHWLHTQRRDTGEPLGEAWRQAILRSAEDDAADSQHCSYWIGKILEQDSDLATAWLIRLVSGEQGIIAYHAGKVAKESATTLNQDQRRTVLRAISPKWGASGLGDGELVGVLVTDSLDLYQELLNSKGLEHWHLTPLAGKPGKGWEAKATLALNAGYSVGEIVEATQNKMFVFSFTAPESESSMWAEWRRAFERLQDDVDPRIVGIGKRGAEIMSGQEQRAREQERLQEIYGLG